MCFPFISPSVAQNWNTASNWAGGADPWAGAAVPSSVAFGEAGASEGSFNPVNIRLPQGNFAMGSLRLKRNMAITLPRDGAAFVFPRSGAVGQQARFTAGQDDLDTACDAGNACLNLDSLHDPKVSGARDTTFQSGHRRTRAPCFKGDQRPLGHVLLIGGWECAHKPRQIPPGAMVSQDVTSTTARVPTSQPGCRAAAMM